MFYYHNWDRFCQFVKNSNFATCTAEESLSTPKDRKFIVLKHDVEGNVPKALKLAEIEHRYGIRGSYYVQAYLIENPENVSILKKMKELGHEISYHYDVLDANSGDFEKAEKDFAYWIKQFNENGFVFKTICQHGNPIKKRVGYTSNRDFFRNPKIKAKYNQFVDMVVDYSQYIGQWYNYISDAGYMWKHITEPETNDLNPDSPTIPIGNFNRLKEFISNSACSIVLSTHPHRWEESKAKIMCKIGFFKCARTTAKTLQKIPFAYSILNRFYFLAKKI